LYDWLERRKGKARSIEAAVEMELGILAGLDHLHTQQIIHRDLKPANILLQKETPRLADFGIAKLLRSGSQSGLIKGTPCYMAPEAFDGKRNEYTDVWSAGVILYELLSGHLPFPGEDLHSVIKAITQDDPEPLPVSVPSSIQDVTARALAKYPPLRYKSATEMRKDLHDAFYRFVITHR
jgi:serine/threonine-protein kinase